MADPKVKVRILADASQATAELKRAERSMGSFQKKLESTATGDQFQSLGEKVKAFAGTVKKAGLVVGAAVGTMAGAFFELRRAANIDAQTEAFARNLAKQGVALDDFLAKSKAAADGQISQAERVAASSRALLLGIPADKITDLLEIARARSIALGTDVGQAFDDITVGIARKSIPILDNLGFTMAQLKVETAAFAETIGKSEEKFTEQERSAALLNAVLRIGVDDVKAYGDAQGEMGRFLNQTLTLLKDLRDAFSIIAIEGIPNFIRGIKTLSSEIPGLNTALGLWVQHWRNLGQIWTFISDHTIGGLIKSVTQLGEVQKTSVEAIQDASTATFELVRRQAEATAAADELWFATNTVADSYDKAAEAARFWRDALDDAEVNETIDSLEKLGVVLEEDLNSQLLKAEELAVNFGNALRAGTITELDYARGMAALSREVEKLNEALHGKKDATEESTEATRDATLANDEAARSEDRLNREIEETNIQLNRRIILRDAEGRRVGSRLAPSGGLFPGLSGGSYTYTQQRSTTDATGRVVFNAAASNFGGLA